jgi:hypothetical protein
MPCPFCIGLGQGYRKIKIYKEKKVKKNFSILLVTALVITGTIGATGMSVSAAERESETYTIDEAWDYTVTPEWMNGKVILP